MQLSKDQEKQRILVLDELLLTRALIQETLQNNGFPLVDTCSTAEDAKNLALTHNYSVILLSCELTGVNSLAVVSEMISLKPKTPLVILSGTGSMETAFEAMRHGAFDVLEKPIHPEKLFLTIHRALEWGLIKTEVIRLHTSKKEEPNTFHGLIGQSSAMKRVFEMIERIKGSSINVLITGPSGSGKEMVAQALHNTSARARSRFVAINCSAIPDTLLEGELFGYKKGAFTDARMDKDGLFAEADQGTLFLDEIGDMPLSLQPKILRAIQEKEIRPLGSVKTVEVDVRIISATNQDLQARIKQQLFREDLYYRLDTLKIELPPLRERTEDIPLLVEHFMEQFKEKNDFKLKGISQKAMRLLMHYSWPGNIRELANVIERALLLAKNGIILPEDLLFTKYEEVNVPVAKWVKARRKLDDIEREYIMHVLRSVNGNRSQTATILGIGRKTLYNKLARYGL